MQTTNQFKQFNYYMKQIVTCKLLESLQYLRNVIVNSALLTVTERDLLLQYCVSCEKYKK